MTESIFARVSRIVSATLEDSVDRLEQAGGEAVMREAIREADRAVDAVGAELEGVTARRLHAARQQRLLDQRIAELSDKAAFALEAGREDLAEAALSRQIDFEAQARALAEAQEGARAEEARLEEGLSALKARKLQMEEALSAFAMSKRADPCDGAARPGRGPSAERQLDAAERAFDRAMTGAGGGFARADAGTVADVAEIDLLQRRAMLAQRLAALKAQRAA